MTRSSPGGCKSRTSRPTAALEAYAGFLRQRFGPRPPAFGNDFGPGAGRRRGGGGPPAVAGWPAGHGIRRPWTARWRRHARRTRPGDRRQPDRPRGAPQRAQVRDDLLLARGIDRDRPQGAGMVRGADEEGRARNGPGRRLAGRPRAGQDAVRRAGQAARADPRSRGRGDRVSRRPQPGDDPAALPRILADGDDVARTPAREPVLHGRRDDQCLVSRPRPCRTRRK